MEISNLSETKFKVMVIGMLNSMKKKKKPRRNPE